MSDKTNDPTDRRDATGHVNYVASLYRTKWDRPTGVGWLAGWLAAYFSSRSIPLLLHHATSAARASAGPTGDVMMLYKAIARPYLVM